MSTVSRRLRAAAIPALVAMIAALVPAVTAGPANGATPLAFDMVGSASSNLNIHVNPFDGAFSSAGDGFQKYQRGVSASIPFGVLDDSAGSFPPDDLGIIGTANTDVFFGIIDTENDDNSGPVSANWVFDVSGATGDLGIAIDMGAMGDFESTDGFEWTYTFAGEAEQTAFASSVDEAGSLTYTMEGGLEVQLNDPMLVNGTTLDNNLATFETLLDRPAGALSTLTVELTAQFDSGGEAVAFQNLIILDGFDPPLTVSCGSNLETDVGVSVDGMVTALDENDTTSIALVSDDLGSALNLGTQTGGGVGETATLPFTVDDTAPADTYSATFRATNGSGETQDCTVDITVNPAAPLVTIAEIQGDGQFSPLLGQTVRTTGIVTLIDSSGTDAWIQMVDGGDGDPATSDGILIDDFQNLNPASPAIGDLIVIEGEVEEVQFGNALPVTRLDDTELKQNQGPGSLPTPIPLIDLPDVSVAEGIDFWEPLEGMLVSAADGTVVAPTSQFGEFAFLTPADAVAGSGFEPSINQIFLRNLGPNEVDYNPERILVDDDGQVDTPDVRPGDAVNSLVGVVDYTFGAYKLQLSSLDVDVAPLPDGPVSTRDGNRNPNTTITTFNVENLFDLFNNPDKDDGSSTPSPGELEDQLTKLALAIETELALPEIMVLQEVENTFIAQELGNRVNSANGTDYIATSFETSDARGIEVAFLWDADRVELLETFQLSGPDVEAAYGPASASPGREPLYGKFRIGKDIVHIVGNHFKSKGGDDPVFGVSFNRITEEQRKLQAQVVRDFVDEIFTEDKNALVMVAGDLNDFPFGEPGEGSDHPVAIVEGSGSTALENLIYQERDVDRWSFVFDGNTQVLDYMLVSRKLANKVRGVDFLHFNAGYPAGADQDPTTTLRAADHDPLEGRFRFTIGNQGGGLSVEDGDSVRFATYNASLNRFNAGDLIEDLTGPNEGQAAEVAEAIQRIRPDVLAINEFDFDEDGTAAQLFGDNYLSVSQNGALPIDYPFRYVAPSNTGVPSGFDLDNNGSVGGPGDAFGFGFFEGQFAFVVYSMYPIDTDSLRTFQNFLWEDMPGNLIPDGFYSPEELDVFRLSSKNHVDLPVVIDGETVHFLVSHPTPPVFDGPEDRNGTRNFDEIRFWADYVDPSSSGYIYDDDAMTGGLEDGAKFVIAGDQNSDPFDGDSIPGAAQQLLDHPLVNATKTPSSEGGEEAAALQGGINDTHLGDPAFDTADFGDTAPGNLRVDYVLPSANFDITDSGVFWPVVDDPLARLVDASDHNLVWVDITMN